MLGNDIRFYSRSRKLDGRALSCMPCGTVRALSLLWSQLVVHSTRKGLWECQKNLPNNFFGKVSSLLQASVHHPNQKQKWEPGSQIQYNYDLTIPPFLGNTSSSPKQPEEHSAISYKGKLCLWKLAPRKQVSTQAWENIHDSGNWIWRTLSKGPVTKAVSAFEPRAAQ